MLRPTFTILRKVVVPSLKENVQLSKIYFSTKSRPKSMTKLAVVSASIGILIGAGYGGYTHYKINIKKPTSAAENEEYAFLKQAPEYKPQYAVISETDTSNLKLILFQYRTCPFCCKVRAYLDARGINYEVVEVDAVLRQAIKWSGYKKVPIVLAKVNNGYQQLLDSTAIISILETYLLDTTTQLRDIIKYYPITNYQNNDGKKTSEVVNKYFVMHNKPLLNNKEKVAEAEERKWRQWADNVLVHMLSPNVYQTPSEALETFKWFEEAGGWRDSFPAWECALMVYVGAAAMWIISKRLKARHQIDDARQSLYGAAKEWTKAVEAKGTPFLGGDKPNLADISVYGVLSSIEGCKAFQDLRNNTNIGKWYDDIRNTIQKRAGPVITTYA